MPEAAKMPPLESGILTFFVKVQLAEPHPESGHQPCPYYPPAT